MTTTNNIIKTKHDAFQCCSRLHWRTLQEEAEASRPLSLLQTRADFLDHLPFKGIPECKQVKLYTNNEKFISAAFQDEKCSEPGNEVLKCQKDDDQKWRGDEKKENNGNKVKDSSD
jgi:hypothetical protein